MPYTIRNARPVLLNYLGLSESNASFLPNTDNWGILYEKDSLKCVIFMMPLGENTSSPKVYFDVRDSGAEKFVAAWNYAEENKLKFFCLGVKDENLKFKNYVVSIEADIHTVLKVSGLENGRRSGSGTQLNIPSDLIPNGNLVRAKSNKFDIFFSVIDKSYLQNYLEIFDNRLFQFINSGSKEFSGEQESSTGSKMNFSQIIYYGVPGSGKSHKIDEETKTLSDEQKMRVVFHPEYTNADFVGQILPVIEEGSGVRYAFKPGAFTKILIEALKNPSKPYYLIIEEINRGNAAAIFGEIFQLLDRGSNGWSSYCIMNDDINYEIRKSVPELNWSENTGIRLPPNLSLLATMNTSDQNVFTLDNAFQRRWDMQLVPNECADDNQMEATITVKDQKISWKDFQQTINSVIGEKSNEGGLSSMEDKRLGCWFVKAENKEIKADVFANKVLKYLWDDAFKFYHQEIFGAEIKNFEELQKSFFEKGFAVFSDACGLKIEKTSDGHAELDSTSENIDSESSSE